MKNLREEFWERSWSNEDIEELKQYLVKYNKRENEVIDIFKNHKIKHVCDAACGFGAYSLMLSTNGFQISGFDISKKAVDISRKLLKNYGIDAEDYRVSSITDIDFKNEEFQGVTAHSVLDHLTVDNSIRALQELMRITVKEGLIFISFDGIEDDDLNLPHRILEDGSFLYTEGRRKGMIFKYYTNEDIDKLTDNLKIISRKTMDNGERKFIIEQ